MDPFVDIWPFSLLLLNSFSRRPCPKPTANTWPLWEHEKVSSGQVGSLEREQDLAITLLQTVNTVYIL